MRRITRGKALIGYGGVSCVTSGGTSLVLTALADGAGTTVTFTATGPVFGDHVLVSNGAATLSGVTITPYVHGAGTVGIRFQNESGGTVTLGTATYNYLVLRG